MNKYSTLIRTLIIIFIDIFLYKIFIGISNQWNINFFVLNMLREAFLLICVCMSAVILRRIDVIEIRKTGIREGISSAMFYIVIIMIKIVLLILKPQKIAVSWYEIVLFAFYIIILGIAEEWLFRGILQNAFHDFFKMERRKNIYLAIIFSGIVFGLVHITNIVNGVDFQIALIQAIVNIPNGILLGAIYYRAKRNLWITVIIHSMIDACSFVDKGILCGATQIDAINNAYNFGAIVQGCVVIIVFLWIMRKKKIYSTDD